MKCTSPIIAIWYSPAYAGLRPFKEGSYAGYTLNRYLDKPFVLSKYHENYSGLTPCHILGLPETFSDIFRYIQLPCGHCLACRLKKASEWVSRNLAELRYHSQASFITLTVSPENEDKVFPRVNGFLSLSYAPFQLFLKRLRSHFDGTDIRFYMCGEYGDNFSRPHYHSILYGVDFDDKVPWSSHDGYIIYRSSILESLWPYGFSTIGAVSEESIQYTCRYVCKKITGQASDDFYQGRMPEFVRMSLKPGIGAQFFLDFCGEDFYKIDKKARKLIDDSFSIGSRTIKPPRYYDKLFERLHNADFVQLKQLRAERAEDLFSTSTAELLRKQFYMSVVTSHSHNKGSNNV